MCDVAFKCPGHEFYECEDKHIHCKNCPDVWTKQITPDEFFKQFAESNMNVSALGNLSPILKMVQEFMPLLSLIPK